MSEIKEEQFYFSNVVGSAQLTFAYIGMTAAILSLALLVKSNVQVLFTLARPFSWDFAAQAVLLLVFGWVIFNIARGHFALTQGRGLQEATRYLRPELFTHFMLIMLVVYSVSSSMPWKEEWALLLYSISMLLYLLVYNPWQTQLLNAMSSEGTSGAVTCFYLLALLLPFVIAWTALTQINGWLYGDESSPWGALFVVVWVLVMCAGLYFRKFRYPSHNPFSFAGRPIEDNVVLGAGKDAP